MIDPIHPTQADPIDLVTRLKTARYAISHAEETARRLPDQRLTVILAGLRLILEDMIDTHKARCERETIP
jgi:hypothetical protein